MRKIIRNVFSVFSFNNQPFNSNIWKLNPGKRKRLIRDFIRKNMAVGKSHGEILEMFGYDVRMYSDGIWMYPVDDNRSGRSRMLLQLYFNADETVSYALIRKKNQMKDEKLTLLWK